MATRVNAGSSMERLGSDGLFNDSASNSPTTAVNQSPLLGCVPDMPFPCATLPVSGHVNPSD